ncbi:hypothetical protein [Aquimarina sp. Aq78]|nr:hypothetical protein [Aquimarina sp. Aq78]
MINICPNIKSINTNCSSTNNRGIMDPSLRWDDKQPRSIIALPKVDSNL